MPVIFQYAVKIVLGATDDRRVIAPGEYWTAINVRNPFHYTDVRYRKRVFIGLPQQVTGPTSGIFWGDLKPDKAHEIDREDDIYRSFQDERFLKGFLVIESPTELDVVAVYTASSFEGILQAFHTERVTPRVLEIRDWEEWVE